MLDRTTTTFSYVKPGDTQFNVWRSRKARPRRSTFPLPNPTPVGLG